MTVTSPSPRRSPDSTLALQMRRPLTSTPLRDARSSTDQPAAPCRSSAWRRETEGSARRTSQSQDRPTTNRPTPPAPDSSLETSSRPAAGSAARPEPASHRRRGARPRVARPGAHPPGKIEDHRFELGGRLGAIRRLDAARERVQAQVPLGAAQAQDIDHSLAVGVRDPLRPGHSGSVSPEPCPRPALPGPRGDDSAARRRWFVESGAPRARTWNLRFWRPPLCQLGASAPARRA